MNLLAATLPPALASNILVVIELLFWIYVPVSFICVSRYAIRQIEAGRLVNNASSPDAPPVPAIFGWIFVACVLEFIFVQSLLYVVVVLVGTALLLVQSGRTVEQQFGFDRVPIIRAVSWSLLVFGAVMLVEAPLMNFILWLLKATHLPYREQESVESFRHMDDPSTILLFIFQAAFLFPIVEELFFRGFLFPFLKKYTSTWLALILSAGVFAFAHANLGAAIPLWFLGMALALAYEHTGSLLVPIGVHACWNLVTAVSLLIDKGSPP